MRDHHNPQIKYTDLPPNIHDDIMGRQVFIDENYGTKRWEHLDCGCTRMDHVEMIELCGEHFWLVTEREGYMGPFYMDIPEGDT